VHYRTASENGYDVELYRGILLRYLEYKNGILDGLCVYPNDPARPNTKFDRCFAYLRFVKGKALGKYIVWDENGLIASEMEFKKPFDILKYSAAQFDLSWTKLPTNIINSDQRK
jgi:antitoxin component YwqK of YwqJK toxin-antitoxin module